MTRPQDKGASGEKVSQCRWHLLAPQTDGLLRGQGLTREERHPRRRVRPAALRTTSCPCAWRCWRAPTEKSE